MSFEGVPITHGALSATGPSHNVPGDIQFYRSDAFRLEAGIYGKKLFEAAHKEQCPYQQHHRE